MDNGKILVVDGDHDTVDLITFYLNRNGYRVLSAYDGLQALDLARGCQPDLVLLDLMLPGLSGLEVCYRLRAESGVPIIIVTGCVRDEDKVAGLTMGADDYMTKPFRLGELLAHIRAVLRHSERARSYASPQCAWACSGV